MRARLTKVAAAIAAVSALAVGGAALAGAATPSANPPAPVVGVQDTTTPDAPGTPAESSSESASSESSSESAAPNDGPGGHADDPANAGLDYQFQGEQ